MTVTVLDGDARSVLATLPDASVQCCVTSPPYFGLRDYGVDGQIGIEASPNEYVAELVAVFREVRRVLKDDGTLWLNLGDSYNAYNGGAGPGSRLSKTQTEQRPQLATGYGLQVKSMKPKDLLGIPWRVAFALQADGWYLRSDIIWHKPNPMPESVTDRPTKAHEYVFLLSKSARYFYDADAIAEPVLVGANGSSFVSGYDLATRRGLGQQPRVDSDTRNVRSVWPIATQPFKGAHFATMPPELAKRCILAGSKPNDTVLDPFGGAGTTGLVADRLGRDAVLIELNSTYAQMARERIRDDNPLQIGGAA